MAILSLHQMMPSFCRLPPIIGSGILTRIAPSRSGRQLRGYSTQADSSRPAPGLPAYRVTPRDHTMGDSLQRYLSMKIHPMISEASWENVVIVGRHDRTSRSVVGKEKGNKPFNWMRPTARLVDRDLHIQCFPGSDHVQHYAALISTYLDMNQVLGRDGKQVFYQPVPPGETTRSLLTATNFPEIPEADVVVAGLVHRLGNLTGDISTFEGSENDEFAWTLKEIGPHRKRVLFLGCRFSFWGTISGDLVRLLACRKGAKKVLYFGKLGTTIPFIQPNRWLATGSVSTVLGREVIWTNALDDYLSRSRAPVIWGKHETLPSVLFETNEWLRQSVASGHQFVDPEVGSMAFATVESGIDFGYIHIISDNVAKKYSEDLSNERENAVLVGRDRLYSLVGEILEGYLAELAS